MIWQNADERTFYQNLLEINTNHLSYCMKLFIKILAGILLFFIILIIGLNIYFTDERLKSMIVPQINQALDREVQIDRMSMTFFRTFPRFGLQVNGFMLPDDEGEPVAEFDELTASVRIFPLLRDEISISRLNVINPNLFYKVFADSTTNIDFLLTEDIEEPEETERGYTIQIPRLDIHNAGIFYTDAVSESTIELTGLNADISLIFSDLIESTVDANLESFSANYGGTQYVTNLALSLQQQSVINMDDELLTLADGTFSIRGLALDISGTFGKWSSEAPEIDFQFHSTSDNFGELLRLAPSEYDEYLQGLESSGSLTFEGNISGILTEGEIPGFDITAEVTDGYLMNPDLQEPIRDINFSLIANNYQVSLNRFSATAAGNRLNASGLLERPFDEDASFSMNVVGDIDLETISQFYPIDQVGIEILTGLLAVDMDAAGNIQYPEEALFNGSLTLQNGVFKYIEVPRPIENIEADLQADQNRIIINKTSFRASDNRFSMSGSITEPLAEMPSFDIDADLDFDLETIKDFYPIDEDTLMLRGQLIADARLRGQADQFLRAIQESNIRFQNGYVAHRSLGAPLEEITFIAGSRNTRLTINESSFRTGDNNLSMTGTVDDFLDDDPVFDLTLDGSATLADVSTYYSLEPWINELSGFAVMNLNARGPAGDPKQINLNGSLRLNEVHASGDSLALPVSNLEGILSVQPDAMTLEHFFMHYGTSDFTLQGRLQNYLGFMQEHETAATMPAINGSYHSRLLNLDEMFDWDEEDEDPLHIELPNMTSTVTAQIDTLMIFGVPIYNIRGSGHTGPEQLVIDEASAVMFDGTANGRLVWAVPQPDYTNLQFIGELSELQVNAFFREFPILGENSRFEQHVTGGFSANVDYYTELDEYIDPVMSSTVAEGSFGMTRARLRGHPVQERLADWLGFNELRSMALDEWDAEFSIRESVLTLTNFRLTSDNIGIELDGTQHLETDEIDFTAQLLLPSRFRSGIASVISSRAVDALTRDDGIIVVPIRITGTMGNPQISPRQSIIEDLLRDAGRDALRRLFDRN